MSYGPDLKETVERAAAMVDRIFQGSQLTCHLKSQHNIGSR